MSASRVSLFWLAYICIQWGSSSALQRSGTKVIIGRSGTSTTTLEYKCQKSSFQTQFHENRFSSMKDSFSESVARPILVLAAILSAGTVFMNPQPLLASSADFSSSSITLSQAATAQPEKWDSARFLEEQDNGRLVRVTYSSDGKTATGIDVDNNRFIASLQAEQNGLPLIIAPIVLLGIGAFAFSRSSEGQAIKVAAGFDGDSGSTSSTMAPSSTYGEDSEKEDRSYEFESLVEGPSGLSENTDETPEYLISCLLSGSYYLPQESLLRSQSSAGRRIKYDSYSKITPDWKPLGPGLGGSTDSTFGEALYADITRTTYGENKAATLGVFRLYKFKLKSDDSQPLNTDLSKSVIREAEDCLGIAVSNAGGYHSTKDYFKNEGNDPSIAKISSFSEQAVKIAELHDFQQSQESAKNAMQVDLAKGINLDKLRSFLPSNDQEESWVNINRNGHWNRLHTHAGASWSGVYYIQSNKESLLRNYSGRLLLKPTSHPLESGYALSDIEKARLSVTETKKSSLLKSNLNICDYIEIPPEEGMMILLPSWLQHSVIPLSVKTRFKARNDGARISLAFNFNQA